MVKKANIVGIFLGTIFTVSVIGWFGYQHYESTRDDRLPLKIKQKLINFQKQLPIRLSQSLMLERFQLRRNSVDFVLRSTHHIKSNIPKDEITFRTHFFICKWRERFVKKIPIALHFKLLGPSGSILTSVDNTPKICANLPAKLTTKHQL